MFVRKTTPVNCNHPRYKQESVGKGGRVWAKEPCDKVLREEDVACCEVTVDDAHAV